MPNKLYLTPWIALFYAIGAQLGFLVGLLPSTPITLLWPPSGLAVAAVLMWGRKALPGIFLGALITNLLLVLEEPGWAIFGAGVIISAASTLAAMATGVLLKRFAPSAPVWDRGADILIGSIVMGLACAIPTVIGTASLYVAHQLTIEMVRPTMAMWWLGDFCGMLIFTPVVYAVTHRWFSKYLRHSSKTKLPIFPVFLNAVIAIIALMSFLFLWLLEGVNISRGLEREALVTANSLTQALHRAGRDMASIRALLTASEYVTEEEFLQFTTELYGNKKHELKIYGVGWAPRVTDPEAWESKMLANGSLPTGLFELDRSNNRIPVKKRSMYFPLQYIYSDDSISRGAVGFDIASETLRRRYLERARDTGQLSMAVPHTLTRSAAPELAAQIFLPVYHHNKPIDTVEKRRANLIGVISGGYEIDELMHYAFLESLSGFDIDLHLFDVSLPAKPLWYHTKTATHRSELELARQPPSFASLTTRFNGTASVHFASQDWLVVATPGAQYIASQRSWTPWGGLLLILALGIVLSSIILERILARKRVSAEKTKTERALHDARAANESKSYFMAAASHDIKQPLYALSMLTDSLVMSDPPEAVRPIVQGLSKSIKEMSQHFDTLMDVGRFQDGGFEIIQSKSSLADLARRVDLEIAPLCSEKGLNWILDVDDALVLTDIELVLRLIRNLLVNAVRYTATGEVGFTAKLLGDTVTCKIFDSGQGLSRSQQELIFREVHQVDKDVHTSGHGLGLSIVYKVSHALDLGIKVASDKNQGSEFTFYLKTAH